MLLSRNSSSFVRPSSYSNRFQQQLTQMHTVTMKNRHAFRPPCRCRRPSRPRKYGKTGRYRASNPAEDDMPRPSDVAHASNGQETHFLPPSTAAMASARLVAGIPPARLSGALGLTRFWTTPDFARLATHEFVRMWPNQRYAVCIWMLSTSPGTTEGSADVDRAFETVVCLGDAPYGAAV